MLMPARMLHVRIHADPDPLTHHGQWWSNLSTQLSQMEQCEALGGRKILQVKQYFSLIVWLRTTTSRVRGGGRKEALPAPLACTSI